MNSAPAYVMRVADAPRAPDFPSIVVPCQCGVDCYCLLDTLVIMAQEGFLPVFVCRVCAPEHVRLAAEDIIANQKEYGIEDGGTVRVSLDEEGGTVH